MSDTCVGAEPRIALGAEAVKRCPLRGGSRRFVETGEHLSRCVQEFGLDTPGVISHEPNLRHLWCQLAFSVRQAVRAFGEPRLPYALLRRSPGPAFALTLSNWLGGIDAFLQSVPGAARTPAEAASGLWQDKGLQRH